MTDPQGSPPVAIVGLATLFAGSADVTAFWRDVLSAKDRITDVPPSHWLIDDYYDPDPKAEDKTYCRRGGFLDPVPFDPIAFGVPPNAIPSTDTAQLLALIAAKRALDDAARTRTKAVDKDRISVVLGVASTTELVVEMGARLQQPVWRKALREAGLPEAEVDDICKRIAGHYVPWQESTFPGLLGNVVAGRIANRLDLGGMNFVTDAACASSLSALQVGLRELYLGDSDMVLAGGVDALNDIMMYMCFSKTPAFSPTGDCRPFSDQADGTIIGEGVGILALRRLEDAERDGDAIYAVIRGIGASSDGRASSVYAPRPEGQAKALLRAYEKAGYDPSTVELVEAHGTGTKAGDAAEFKGLVSVFGAGAGTKTCALGSIKSQLGHTKAAAGAAGLAKTALALHHKVLPPTLKVDRPNPALGIDTSPFYLNTAARPWIHAPGTPRRAAVSSFGFGGSNFHVTLEEYSGRGTQAPRLRALPEELVVLSAPAAPNLADAIEAAIASVKDGASLAFIAHAMAQRFDPNAQARAAIVAADTDDFVAHAEKAAAALRSGGQAPAATPDVAIGFGAPSDGKTAFLFPGQGSQYVGMGSGIANHFDAARQVWDEAARLAEFADAPLHTVTFPVPAFDDETRAEQDADLTRMANAQPAIAASSLSYHRLLSALGIEAHAVAGHSFGEITALSVAGVLPHTHLLPVARMRGALMTEAAAGTDGAMLAVSANAERIAADVDLDALGVVIANDNAPGQCVLAGTAEKITLAQTWLKAAGYTTFRLPVASAFHSSIVAGSCAPFQTYLTGQPLSRARIPVYSNTTAAPYPTDADDVPRRLGSQLAKPVRFREMIDAMYADGIRTFIEVGPGKVLTGLVGECLKGRPHLAVALDDKKTGGLRAFWRGIARLAVNGHAVDLAALMGGYAAPDAPTKPSAHTIMITGANYGRPYPPKAGAAALPAPNPPRRAAPAPSPTPSMQSSPPIETESVMRKPPTVTEPISTQPAAQAAAPAALSADRLDAIARFQQETLEAHRHYQSLMAESHRDFLRMAGESMALIAGAPAPNAWPITHIPPAIAPPTDHAMPTVPVPPSIASPPLARQPVAAAPAPPQTAAAPNRSADAASIVIEIVADKTGYPEHMLDLDMEIEAGLGIDSIKQVEILSALQDRMPDLPEIEPSELSTLKTLRDVVSRLSAPVAPAIPEATAAPRAKPSVDASSVSVSSSDPRGIVLAIVAAKTGYPEHMLDLDMEMEAGLGIDSIKQVEILSALQDRMPDLPEIEPSELSTLKTLGDIVRRLGRSAHPSPAGEAQKTTATTMRQPPGGAGAASAAPALSFVELPRPAHDTLSSNTPMVVARQPTGIMMGALLADPVVVITNECPRLASALAESLRARSIRTQIVDDIPDDAQAVVSLAALADAGASASLDVHLKVLRAARTVARHIPVSHRLLVTVQSSGGDFGFVSDPGDRAWFGGVCGIVKTAAAEWPEASVKAIDIASRAGAAELIAQELVAGGPEIEVGFAPDGTRHGVADAVLDVGIARDIAIPAGSVIVVSGGARGVTPACASALAATTGAKLLLLGRTPLIDPPADLPQTADHARLLKALAARAEGEGRVIALPQLRKEASAIAAGQAVRATLADMKRRGIDAAYMSADIADEKAVSAAVAHARATMGPISGIVHGAGILADKRIADLTDAHFESVFTTKVRGLMALLRATEGDALGVIALFSSVAARKGNVGQSAYAAANEVLNKVAQAQARRRGATCRVRSYNWGPWDGGMVDGTLKGHFERMGVALIREQAGADAFVSDLGHGGGPVERVIAAGWPDIAPPRPAALGADPSALPYLKDHMIGGRIVLPIAQIAAWGFALSGRNGPAPLSPEILESVAVLGGVTFEAADAPPRMRIVPGDGITTLEDETGRARYQFSTAPATRRRAPPRTPSGGLEPWPFTAADAYRDILFHGRRFQLLGALDGVSDDGGLASLEAPHTLGWDAGNAFIGVLDAGLQLGLLWSYRTTARKVLPQKLGRVTWLAPIDPAAPLRCAFAARPAGASRVDFDFVFGTLAGDIVLTVENAEFFKADI